MEHPGASAFRLGPEEGPRAVLFHGLTGAPSEVWPLACGLAAMGFRVEAPLHPGHGTRPSELARVNAEDVLLAARRTLSSGPPPTLLAGLSMGALVATTLAAERPTLPRLVLLAPAVRLTGSSRMFDLAGWVPVLSSLPRLVFKGGPGPMREALAAKHADARVQAAIDAAVSAPEAPGWDGRYSEVPLAWGRELRRLRSWALGSADRIRTSTLVVHGALDQTASPLGAELLARKIGPNAVLRVFPQSPHVLTLGPERGAVVGEIAAFVRDVASNEPGAGATGNDAAD